jgi:hypothetical protein
MAAADAIIDVQVNGLSGPVCTLQAHMSWSIAVFKAALAQRLGMQKEALRLLHGHGEAVLDADTLLGDLPRDGPLMLSLVKCDLKVMVSNAGFPYFNGTYLEEEDPDEQGKFLYRQLGGYGLISFFEDEDMWLLSDEMSGIDYYRQAGTDLPQGRWMQPSRGSRSAPAPLVHIVPVDGTEIDQMFTAVMKYACAGLKVLIRSKENEDWTLAFDGQVGEIEAPIFENDYKYLVRFGGKDYVWMPTDCCMTCLAWVKEAQRSPHQESLSGIVSKTLGDEFDHKDDDIWEEISVDSVCMEGQFGPWVLYCR